MLCFQVIMASIIASISNGYQTTFASPSTAICYICLNNIFKNSIACTLSVQELSSPVVYTNSGGCLSTKMCHVNTGNIVFCLFSNFFFGRFLNGTYHSRTHYLYPLIVNYCISSVNNYHCFSTD